MARVLALTLLFVSSLAHAEGKIVFFDPDANHEVIVSIATLFNSELAARKTGLEFQPVVTRENYEALSKQAGTSFAIVSSGVLQREKGGLTPILVPESKGSVYYQKLLVATKLGDKRDFRKKILAATVSDQESKGVLKLLATHGMASDGAFVVSVSKDVDALLAVTFGQADAAIVTEASIDVAKRINPVLASQFQVVWKTADILRSPLCQLKGRASKGEREQLMQALTSLDDNANGKRLLQFLNTEKWVPFSPNML